MRFFMGVLAIVIGITFTDPVSEAVASIKTSKGKVSLGRKVDSGPSDVWVRIRSGMSISRLTAPDSKVSTLQQDFEPQAAVRSRSSMVNIESRKHFKEKQGFSKISFDAALSVSMDPELSRPKFAPTHYTELGKKMLGVKHLSAGDIDCESVSARGYQNNALAEGSQTVLPVLKERIKTGDFPAFRRKRGLGLNLSRDDVDSSTHSASQHKGSSVNSVTRCAEKRQNKGQPNLPAIQDYPAGQQNGDASIEQRIDRFIAAYTRNPDFLFRVAERARPYLYHIVEELSRYRLPLEMALLPILESAYQPTAESPKRAKGLWQFIPGTGSDFDLMQSRDYDERLDIAKSTQAAIRFLSSLNGHFNGDWLLALAAYNAGQATVDNAVGRNRAESLPADFWSLNLPQETRDYVPRLLALSAIFSSPESYGIALPPIRNAPYFVKIEIDHEFDVNYLAEKKMASIAELAGLPPDQFRRLNPSYLGPTLPRRPYYSFLLPPANAVLFRRRLANHARFMPESAELRKTIISAENPDASTDL